MRRTLLRMKRLCMIAFLSVASLTPGMARTAPWADTRGSYNYYQERGNREAMIGSFDAAIAGCPPVS